MALHAAASKVQSQDLAVLVLVRALWPIDLWIDAG
jgi:hypothetical protein